MNPGIQRPAMPDTPAQRWLMTQHATVYLGDHEWRSESQIVLRRRYERRVLTTVKGLELAKRQDGTVGYVLTDEQEDSSWGSSRSERRRERTYEVGHANT